jgi:hypothetical protein
MAGEANPIGTIDCFVGALEPGPDTPGLEVITLPVDTRGNLFVVGIANSKVEDADVGGTVALQHCRHLGEALRDDPAVDIAEIDTVLSEVSKERVGES